MKYALILPLLLFVLHSSKATNYYFSSNGDDSRSPQQASSPNTPWRSIKKLNEFFKQLQPGDSVLFKCGEEFVGTLNAGRAGASGKPIAFGSYGSGKKPVISGFLLLKNWSNKGNNLWEAECPTVNPVNVLAINSISKHLGRYPNFNNENGGYLKVESHYALDNIYNKTLAGQNWVGGEAVIRKNRWILDRDPIIIHSGNGIKTRPTSSYEPKNNFGFFIQNHLGTLDQDGEWYYSKTTKKMYLYSTSNPSGKSVRASVLENVFIAHNFGYFSFSNISFEGANNTLIRLQNTSNITFNNCNMHFAGNMALNAISADNISITNSSIIEINNIGLIFDPGSRYAVIKNNKIRNIANMPGMGASGNESYHAIISRGGSSTIEQNVIDSIGYVVIRFEGNDVVIKNNLIDHFMTSKDDGAAIYTWKGEANKTPNYNRKIVGNIILNGKGEGLGTENKDHIIAAGIYLDDNTDNVEVTDNSVAHCSYAGLYLHNTHDIRVQRNTFFDNGQQVSLAHDENAPNTPLRNITFTDNVLFSNNAEQLVLKVRTIKNDIPSFGLFNNNHYSRPKEGNFYIHTTVRKNGVDVYQSTDTDGWRTSYSLDQASKKSALLLLPVITSKLLGSNKIVNGTYVSGVRDESCYSPIGDCKVSWLQSSKLDGGAMQVSFARPGATNTVYLTVKLRDIVAGKKYALRFSMAGKPTANPMQIYLRKKDAPYDVLTDKKWLKISEARTENTLYVQASKTQTEAVLVFEVRDPLGTFWVDNLEVFEAQVTETMPNTDVRFDYNASMSSRNFVLDKAHIDGKGAYRTGAVSLPAFSSIVLIENDFGVLAPDYLKLDANRANSDVKLSWIASNNRPVSSYEIQRSVDHKSFSPIGQLSMGNSRIDPNQSELSFNYNDRSPLKQHNYYRVKSVGEDGKLAYSNIIYLAADTKLEWKLFPNPASDKVRLQFGDLKFKTGRISIYNIAGVEVYNSNLQPNSTFAEIDISKLSEGSYIMKVSYDDQLIQKAFVKVK